MAPIGLAFPDAVTAGSALIQACEKAGSTVPRYVPLAPNVKGIS